MEEEAIKLVEAVENHDPAAEPVENSGKRESQAA
jgi:hypothetical protein